MANMLSLPGTPCWAPAVGLAAEAVQAGPALGVLPSGACCGPAGFSPALGASGLIADKSCSLRLPPAL